MSRFVEPSAVRTLTQRLQDANLSTSVDDTLATLMRGLVASTRGGVYLLSGERLTAYAGWLLDGMDIESRLIVNLPSRYSPAVVQPCFDVDLRITGHVQPIDTFVADVTRHRFALVAIDCAQFSGGDSSDAEQTLNAVSALIDAGGWWMLIDPPENYTADLLEHRGSHWCATTGLVEGRVELLCRRVTPLNNRRGGRRGRVAGRST